MISGALLLGKQEDIKTLCKKRIVRIIAVIILASFAQYICNIWGNFEEFSIKSFFRTIYSRNILYSYWFLYAYLAFLILLPFLRLLVKNIKKEHYYYLFTIYVIYKIIVPIITQRIGLNIYDYLELNILETNILCPLLGYFCENVLKKDEVNKKIILIATIILVMVIGIAITLTILEIEKTGDKEANAYLNYGVAYVAMYVYIAIKYLFEGKELPKLIEKIVLTVGTCSFGIYLMEVNIRRAIFNEIINLLSPFIKTLPACIIGVLCVIFIGTIITMILKKTPIIKKLI